MAVSSSQLWTKGTSAGDPASGYVRIFIDDNNIMQLVNSDGDIIKINGITTGTSDPTSTTNPGYIGAFYLNTGTKILFTCTDATADSNVWSSDINISGASNPTASTNPARVGILFTNTTSGIIFTCTDATAGANHWIGTDGTSI